MADRPILFSAPMVRALLAGTKTQTRRILKPQPFDDGYYEGAIECTFVPALASNLDAYARFSATAVGGGAIRTTSYTPRYAVGDSLWVRETWAGLSTGLRPPFVYRADQADGERVRVDAPWKPSIHMPRAASRITLKVTGVKVERLQDISEADVEAEGCRRETRAGMNGWEFHGEHWATFPDGSNACCFTRAADSYRQIWQIINGPGSWDANPWVAAYTFERVAP
jgi:hypothetical protein